MTDNRECLSAAFARKVQQLRKECGWSQEELGRRLGSGQARISRVEQNGRVTLDQADALARELGVPLHSLLCGQPSAVNGIQLRRLAKITATAERLHRELATLIPGQS